MKTTAIILSAGKGKRMGSDISKQYLMLEGYPVIYYTIKAFEDSEVDDIILVSGESEVEFCKKEIVERYGFKKVKKVVSGGKERYHSVYEGLKAIEAFDIDTDIVLIHDGARAFVDEKIISHSINDTKAYGASIAAVKVKDTIKVADKDNFVESTPDRAFLWQIQTPQTFFYKKIMEAYEKAIASDDDFITDDAMVLEHYGEGKIKLSPGSYDNIKITTPEDLVFGAAILKSRLC